MKYFVDIILIILFFIVAVTGIIKFPIFARNVFQVAQLSTIHDFSGLLIVVFVFVHLILNFNFIVCMTKKYLGKGKQKCD